MIKRIFNNKPLIGLIVFIIIVGMINPRFLSSNNLLNVLRQTSVNSIIAIGMTMVILTGGIDLSVGSTLALTGAFCAGMIGKGVNPILAVVISIALGFVIGIINGTLISYAKLQPFIVTLVTMTMLRGATLIYTDGKPIPVRSAGEFFDSIGGGHFLNVPIPIYLMIIFFVLGWYILKNFKFGRYLYAIGGNEEATRLSGINTAKYKTLAYGLTGALASVAGIIALSRLSSAQPTAGQGFELDAIAAVVLGGTSLSGGIGTLAGTALGAVIIGVLGNALNLLNVSSYYQMMVKGAVILIAVLIDLKSKK